MPQPQPPSHPPDITKKEKPNILRIKSVNQIGPSAIVRFEVQTATGAITMQTRLTGATATIDDLKKIALKQLNFRDIAIQNRLNKELSAAAKAAFQNVLNEKKRQEAVDIVNKVDALKLHIDTDIEFV
jgi:hypothetical protein